MVVRANRGKARIGCGRARRNPCDNTRGQAVGRVGEPIDEPVSRYLANSPWRRRPFRFGWRDVKQQRGIAESRRIHRGQGTTGLGQLRGKHPQRLVDKSGRPDIGGEAKHGFEVIDRIIRVPPWPPFGKRHHHSRGQQRGTGDPP